MVRVTLQGLGKGTSWLAELFWGKGAIVSSSRRTLTGALSWGMLGQGRWASAFHLHLFLKINREKGI